MFLFYTSPLLFDESYSLNGSYKNTTIKTQIKNSLY